MHHHNTPGIPYAPAYSAVTAAATAAAGGGESAAAHAFIQRWRGVTASEIATSQSFVIELCELLGVPRPTHEADYMFERPITFQHGDGSASAGRVDCCRRGHFVWESKKLKAGLVAQGSGHVPSKAFDDALLRARTRHAGGGGGGGGGHGPALAVNPARAGARRGAVAGRQPGGAAIGRH